MARTRPGTQAPPLPRAPAPLNPPMGAAPPAARPAWVKPADKAEGLSKAEWAEKDRRIVRQNALSHAADLVGTYCTTRLTPVEMKLGNMAQAVLNLSDVFERWVYRTSTGLAEVVGFPEMAEATAKPTVATPATPLESAIAEAVDRQAAGDEPGAQETAAEAKEDLSRPPAKVPTSPAAPELDRVRQTVFPGRDGVPAPSEMSQGLLMQAASQMAGNPAMAEDMVVSYALLCDCVWHMFGRWPSSQDSIARIIAAVPLSKVCVQMQGVGV